MPPHSTVARIQQLASLGLLALAVGWLVYHWPSSPWRAVAGALAITLWHGLFIAWELLLMRLVSRADPTPPAPWHRLVRAWWTEIWEDVRVFAWRQPFRWRAIPDHLGPQVRGKRGVVFIHGFVCNRGFWNPWLKRVRRAGHAFVAVNLEPVFGPIDDYGAIIERAVRQVTQATGLPPLLVGHSMGGLAARAWLRHMGAAARVHHVITIASPHHGTWMARFSHLANGRQMRPGDVWVRNLQAEEARQPLPPFTCWYSNCDNVVFPPLSATLPGADNRLLPDAAHVDLAFREPVFAHFLSVLQQTP